ncbi:MAG: T9SS type A sorting domain-containing protein [Bacteroidetes bacterium]|nr:T9SS type A sorting domain-containing protein [Bacteroidota bacterium]
MMKKLFFLTAFLGVAIIANAQVWTQQNTNFPGTSIGVDEISVVDANTVWVKGFNGSGTGPAIKAFSKTTNGGTTWTAGTIGLTGTIMPYCFAASSASKAFVIALDTVSSAASYWGTLDGGSTWAPVAGLFGGASSFPDGVKFWDGSKGFCYGDPLSGFYEIYTTTDGGSTWTAATTSVAPVPAATEYGYNGADCATIVPGTGFGAFITNYGRVIKTTDYGVTWSLTPTAPFPSASYGSVKIYASSANYMFAATYVTATTTWTWKITSDGGATWNLYTPASGPWYEYAMCYVPGTPNTFVATSPFSSSVVGVAYSYDGGLNWADYLDPLLQPAGSNVQCLGVGYSDRTTGWVGNYDQATTINSILKYYDPNAGINLQQTVNGNDVNIYPNPTNGLVNFAINGANTEDMNITVFDVMGKMIINQTLNVNGLTNTSFDFSSYAKGVYVVQVTSGTEITTKKLMVQ